MAGTKQRTRVNVDLEPVEAKRLRALASEAERSLSAEVRLAIRAHLEKYGRRGR